VASTVFPTNHESSFVVAQIGLRYMGPLTVVALQYIVALIVLVPFFTQRPKGAAPSIVARFTSITEDLDPTRWPRCDRVRNR
jgi:hypothetical protein